MLNSSNMYKAWLNINISGTDDTHFFTSTLSPMSLCQNSVWLSGSPVAPDYLKFAQATRFWLLVARLGYQET